MPWDDCYDEPCKHKECSTGASLNQQQLKGGGVMGKISSEVTWSVRSYAGAWDD